VSVIKDKKISPELADRERTKSAFRRLVLSIKNKKTGVELSRV